MNLGRCLEGNNGTEVHKGNLQQVVLSRSKQRRGSFFICHEKGLEYIYSGPVNARSLAMLSKGLAKSVLVVDDDEAVLGSMKAVLEFAGFDVNTVCDGAEVREAMGKHRYDVLILDVNMPRIDGVELFQEIRNSGQYTGLPVVFTSGYPVWSEPEEQRRAIFKEANAYLQKPFNINVLMKTVQRLVGK